MCSSPCAASISSSAAVEWPCSRAWRSAASRFITMSPTGSVPAPPSGRASRIWTRESCGKDSTSVASSLLRNSRLRSLISPSSTSSTLNSKSPSGASRAIMAFRERLRRRTSTFFAFVRAVILTSIALSSRSGSGIIHARVQCTCEHAREHSLDLAYLIEGQVAPVQLPVGELVVHYPVDERLDGGRGRPVQSPRARLHGVREHQYAGGTPARLGEMVSEPVLVDGPFLVLQSLLVEEPDQARAVVFPDDVDQVRREVIRLEHLHAVLHVRGDDESAQVGAEVRVRVHLRRLVLHEELGPSDLAYIVIVGSDPGEHLVAAYLPGRRLRKVRHHHAVGVCPGGLHGERLQEFLLGGSQLQQPGVGRDPEGGLQER